MAERRNYRQRRGKPNRLPFDFTDLRQVLDYKKQQKELETQDGSSSNVPPPDPPSLLRDSSRGDESPSQSYRNDHIPSYSYSRHSKGSFRKRGCSTRFMRNESDNRQEGHRKCTIDHPETYNSNRSRGNYGRRNFRVARRGRSNYRRQYFYRGQNKRPSNRDSKDESDLKTEHSAKSVPIDKAFVEDPSEENWDNDAYTDTLNKKSNDEIKGNEWDNKYEDNKRDNEYEDNEQDNEYEDNAPDNEYEDHERVNEYEDNVRDNEYEDNEQDNEYEDNEGEVEYYVDDYYEENADHKTENNNCLDNEIEENTVPSSDGNHQALDIDKENEIKPSQTSNNSNENPINIHSEAQELSEDFVQQPGKNDCSKQDTAFGDLLEKGCDDLQRLTLTGKLDFELKSDDISNTCSKEEIVVNPAIANVVDKVNKSKNQ